MQLMAIFLCFCNIYCKYTIINNGVSMSDPLLYSRNQLINSNLAQSESMRKTRLFAHDNATKSSRAECVQPHFDACGPKADHKAICRQPAGNQRTYTFFGKVVIRRSQLPGDRRHTTAISEIRNPGRCGLPCRDGPFRQPPPDAQDASHTPSMPPEIQADSRA